MSGILDRLEKATLIELREEWGRRHGTPPRLRSPDLLRRIIAWRLQAAAEGGLDAPTRRLLRTSSPARNGGLAPGTLVAREWKGQRHEVEVTEDGFVYREKEYQSLSGIARIITGTRWNGPRFFGLRPEK